jgi:peroxiredoxin
MDMASSAQKTRCPGCGSANYPSDPFCMSCGRELDRAAALSSPVSRPASRPDDRRDRTQPVNATLVLVLGCLSLLLWHFWIYTLLLGPVAWVVGNKALAAWDAGDGSASERTRIQVGRVCGMISTGFLGMLLALLAGLGLMMSGGSAPAVSTNTAAPDFVLPDLAGRQQSLSAYRGQVVLLNFFASWCGPCNAEAPHLERDVWQRWRGRGVVVIGVDTGETGSAAEAAARFQARYQLTYPLLVDSDGTARRAYGVHAFPTSVLIDRRGTVRYTGTGFDPDGIERVLGELMRE